MKRSIIFVLASAHLQWGAAQDQIIQDTAITTPCRVLGLSEDYITNEAPDENLLRAIARNSVKQIIIGHENGNPVGNSSNYEGDVHWQDVRVIRSTSGINPRVPGDTLEVTVRRTIIQQRNQTADMRKAIKELKLLAASRNYPLVRITAIDKRYKGVPKKLQSLVSIKAIAYPRGSEPTVGLK